MEATTRVRANDPVTSVMAAERAERFAGSHADRVMRALGELGQDVHDGRYRLWEAV